VRYAHRQASVRYRGRHKRNAGCMPRRRKPPRLLLERRPGRNAVWIIIDDGRKTRTGIPEHDLRTAAEALDAYKIEHGYVDVGELGSTGEKVVHRVERGYPFGLTQAQAAEFLSLPVPVFRKLVDAGKLPKPKNVAGMRLYIGDALAVALERFDDAY
jgi:hypothetical protein